MADPATAVLTIDLDALAANYAVLRAQAPGAEAAPVVKADGYGLGAGPVGRRLWAEGARSFFVARLSEGEALRDALGLARPATIYVLDGLTAGAIPRLQASGLTPVLESAQQIAMAPAGLDLALQIDTGMNRQGVPAEKLPALLDQVRDLKVGLIMSHLGSATEPADPRSGEQLSRFRDIRGLFPQARASLSASAGIFLGPDYRYDLVRPGISLYGGGPEERPDPRLRAVATLTAPVLYIRHVQPGDRLGYGSGVVVDRPMRVAVIGAGYADGLIRCARGRGYAWLAGARCALLSITMDLTTVEIGDVDVSPGDPVELLGDHVHLDDLAAAAGTVAHEIMVRISARATRVYLGEA